MQDYLKTLDHCMGYDTHMLQCLLPVVRLILYVLQKLMTHKSPKMTQRYAHLRDDTLKNGASQIDTIFNQQKEAFKLKMVNFELKR